MTKIFLPRKSDTPLATIDSAPIDLFRQHNEGGDVAFIDDAENADLVVLFEEWRTQFWSYAETLEKDAFFDAHWRKLYTINCDDLGRGFLPGCYVSLNPRNYDPRLHRPCAYPYRYNQLVTGAARESAVRHLFSFRGTDVSHPVRRELFRQLATHPHGRMICTRTAFHAHDEDQKRAFIDDVLASAFVLCPRGWSPATYRLFEVMELGRCPVIIADDWLPIDGPDWDACAIRVREADVGHLAQLLQARANEAATLGANARAAWEAHFSEPQKFKAMLRDILALHAQGDGGDYRQRWRARAFNRANGWALDQRVAARLSRTWKALRRPVR